MTGDLVEKLRAELDRREALATQASAEMMPWATGITWFAARRRDDDFIAANHPNHVLRTIRAHRKIIDLHCRVDARPDWLHSFAQAACYGCGATFDEEYAVTDANDCPVALALASIYFPESDGATS